MAHRTRLLVRSLGPLVALLPGPAMESGALAATTFTRVTHGAIVSDGGTAFGHGWGDYDGDGDPDLLVCNMVAGQVNFFYRNDGGGSFARILGSALDESGPSASPAWGDWDNDGDEDLHVANGGTTGSAMNFLYRNDGNETFVKITTGAIVTQNRASTATSWADFENDGDLDLFVGRSSFGNHFFTNNGDATFAAGSFPDAGGTWGVGFADYDDDNDLDFFCANWDLVNYLYRNDGGLGFTRITSGPLVTGIAKSLGGSWGDYDGDLDLDLYVTQTLGPNRLFRNDGGGSFFEVTTGAPVTDSDNSESSCWADIDNDADLDLVVSGGGNVAVGTNVVYENDGDGNFARVTTGELVTLPGQYEGLTCVDFDSDGNLDVFLSNYAGDNELFANDGGGGAWLGLSLHGTASNASAVGARATVLATIGGEARRQIREKTSQTGHVAQGDSRLHFGLADATVVDSLTIRWPSGVIETHTNVAVNQYLSLTEGAATSAVEPPRPARGGVGFLQVRPNPSRGAFAMDFDLPRPGRLRLVVYDIRGREIARLPERERGIGRQSLTWDGNDSAGRRVATGIYVVRATLTPTSAAPRFDSRFAQILR